MVNRRVAGIWLILAFLIGSVSCVYSQENVLPELRDLFARTTALEKALGPVQSKISPDIGQMRKTYEESLDRIEFLKNQLMTQLEISLEKNDLQPLDSYIAFVKGFAENDPARTQFLPLSRAVRSKIVFATLVNKHLVREDLQERLQFLEKNRGDPSLADSNRSMGPRRGQVPIHIAFHWHMHQPIYFPYEDILTTHNKGIYSYSLLDVFYSRGGPYTSWPFDAVKACADAGLPSGGAQVSFSGSLIENLEKIAGVNPGFQGWKGFYSAGRRLKTAKGNPRLDMVSFGYHHPLMALVGYDDIRHQIDAHKEILLATLGKDVPYSKGIFPPENAFAEWMIPGLVDSGLEWVMVDNIHFNRACKGYPWVKGENLYPPNPADQTNPDPGAWVQLNGLWAPSKVSAWADRPHWVEFIDPKTGKAAVTPAGKKARIVAVPTERYLGNEDGRGGFGALNYEMVMSQLLPYNTDPKHPLLIVLHHDGDNYGGGSDGYYHANFWRFVEWVKANPDRFICTTIQDYLDQFPPEESDVIHVEPGSWAGADNGDPEFLKWNGDPNPSTGYSPDRNSWGIMTACRNILETAEDLGVAASALKEARRMLMVSQTSCYEYWDGTEMWDSHPARACNKAFEVLLPLLEKLRDRKDTTPPAFYMPQRQPYNPGGMEWGTVAEPSDFRVWTYVYDFGGLRKVTLRYRVNPGKTAADAAAMVLSGGTWVDLEMKGVEIPSQTNPKPLLKAPEFSATVSGCKNALVDYYVSAEDASGNVAESPLLHVFVGNGGSGSAATVGLAFTPQAPKPTDKITFTVDRPGKLHWGVNGWTLPPAALWPQGTVIWADNKAVETPFEKVSDGKFQVVIGPFADPDRPVTKIDVVAHFDDNTWGKDFAIPLR